MEVNWVMKKIISDNVELDEDNLILEINKYFTTQRRYATSGKMVKIDIHTHYLPNNWVDLNENGEFDFIDLNGNGICDYTGSLDTGDFVSTECESFQDGNREYSFKDQNISFSKRSNEKMPLYWERIRKIKK